MSRRSELRSWPTLVLVGFGVFIGIPLVIWLVPAQSISVAGQHLEVGARRPTLSLEGPAQLVLIGNTQLDLDRLQIRGPLRPRLELGPLQRNAAVAALVNPDTRSTAERKALDEIAHAFVVWYAWATVALLVVIVAAALAFGGLRVMLTLRRLSRQQRHDLSVTEIWRASAHRIRVMSVIALVVTMTAWAVAGVLAWSGTTTGLATVHSLADLTGSRHVAPQPVGPPVSGYTGAVIGDSRASRLGGPPVANPGPDDKLCRRSVDSLARELDRLLPDEKVLNLACPGATIAAGIEAPQRVGGEQVPSQFGRLQQVTGLRFVVVMIGPNDLLWSDFLRYCAAVPKCTDNFTNGEFDYRLAAFDRDYGELLQDLEGLPGNPQIIIVTSYDALPREGDCSQAPGLSDTPGLTATNLALLAERNQALNDVLVAGAQSYGFDVATPRLTPLCSPDAGSLPDLQGLDDPYPFHPTGVGMIRIASAVAQEVGGEVSQAAHSAL